MLLEGIRFQKKYRNTKKYKEIQFIETTKEETGNGLLLYVQY